VPTRRPDEPIREIIANDASPVPVDTSSARKPGRRPLAASTAGAAPAQRAPSRRMRIATPLLPTAGRGTAGMCGAAATYDPETGRLPDEG
jgi:hypothetical protein